MVVTNPYFYTAKRYTFELRKKRNVKTVQMASRTVSGLQVNNQNLCNSVIVH